MQKLLRRYFLAGLLVLLPVFLTINILWLALRFLDSIVSRFTDPFFINVVGFRVFGGGLLLLILVTLGTGFLATTVVFKRFLPFLERWFLRLPLVYNIYPAVKQLVSVFFAEEQSHSFKKVVLVQFPRKGVYSIGFITKEFVLQGQDQPDWLCVYISSAPNPITGNIIVVPRADVVMMDLTVEEAFKIIVSGGVLMDGAMLEGKLAGVQHPRDILSLAEGNGP